MTFVVVVVIAAVATVYIIVVSITAALVVGTVIITRGIIWYGILFTKNGMLVIFLYPTTLEIWVMIALKTVSISSIGSSQNKKERERHNQTARSANSIYHKCISLVLVNDFFWGRQ